MPLYRLVPPVIRWGANLANAVYFPFPLDNAISYDDPRAGSQWGQSDSGAEDGWDGGTDFVLEGDARWLQQADSTFYPRCTAWDGSLGVRAALNWMRKKNAFAWHPDGRNLLRLPRLNSAGAIALGGAGGWTTGQIGAPTGVTNAFSGVETAWQTTGTGAGGTCSVFLVQQVPCIPGETFTFSVDYKASGLTGGANGFIEIDIADSSHAFITAISQATGLTATSYTRPSATGVTPANAAFANCIVGITLPIGTTGTIYFRNAMVRRDSSDATFIDNPSIDSYLVSPLKSEPPAPETDGTRKFRIVIRNPSVEYGGY
jgi:hypothetical protein